MALKKSMSTHQGRALNCVIQRRAVAAYPALVNGSLQAQQRCFFLDTPGIAGQPPISTHDAVARDKYRYGITPHGAADRTGAGGKPVALCQLSREVAVRNSASPWNAL